MNIFRKPPRESTDIEEARSITRPSSDLSIPILLEDVGEGVKFAGKRVGSAGRKVIRGARTVGEEFRDFITRGNVIDLAIAVIMGAALGKVLDSAVTDLFTPFLALTTAQASLMDAHAVLRPGTTGGPYPSLSAAKAAGAITFNYGSFLNTTFSFLITALVMFLIFKSIILLYPLPLAKKICDDCAEQCNAIARCCPNCNFRFAPPPPPRQRGDKAAGTATSGSLETVVDEADDEDEGKDDEKRGLADKMAKVV